MGDINNNSICDDSVGRKEKVWSLWMKKTKNIPRVPIELLTCKGKIQYTSVINAIEARDKLSEKIPDKKFTVYICRHCGEYHVGGMKQ